MSTDGLLQLCCVNWPVWKDGATFESVESNFSCARCIRQRSVEAPWLWLNMAMQILGGVEPEWVKKEMGVLRDHCEGQAHQDMQFYVGRQLLDHSKTHLEQMMQDLLEEAERTWNRKQQVLWWTATCASELTEESFRVWGYRPPIKQGETQDCLEDRMQHANKAWWRDVKCRRMVEHLHSAFCLGSEHWSWSHARLGQT